MPLYHTTAQASLPPGTQGFCRECGATLSSKRATVCRPCYYRHMATITGPAASRWKGGKPLCVDCGKTLWYGSVRCRQCNGLCRRQPMHNRSLCIDCGGLIWYRALRCKPCEFINRRKPPKACMNCGGPATREGARCLSCYRLGDSGRLWQEGELEFLRQHYKFLPASEVAIVLGRSVHAVSARAFLLKLQGDRRTHYRDNWAYVQGNPYMESLSKEEAAYIAGIFDGEGDLGLKGGRWWDFGITNTNVELVQYLEAKIAGSSVTWSTGNGRHRPCAGVRLHGNLKIRCLLLLLLPYLIVKRERSLAALQSIEELEKDVFEFQRGMSESNESVGVR